ncbi:MAG: phage tail-like protein [Myxococcota bacterium]|jgi:phage tail-like protein
MPFNTPTNDFIGSFNFIVKVAGMTHDLEGFTKCSAIKAKVETINWKNGTDMYVRKAPGRTEWEDVTLERIYSGRDELHNWWEEIIAGNISRKTVSITFLRHNGTEVVRKYDLLSAYPSAWELPELDATGSNGATEKITLSCERCIMVE